MEDALPDFTPGRPLRAYDRHGQFRDFSTDQLVGLRLNQFKDWVCAAGTANLQINMDGDIFGASCRVGGKLGNIFEQFSVPKNWVTCPMAACSCGADLFIPKVKTPTLQPLLRKTAGLGPSARHNPTSRAEIVALERTHAANSKQVFWEIGRRCNFDCSYCWPWIHNNHQKHRTLAELITATEKLETEFIRGEKINFIISGGEPTVNPAFLEWMQYLSQFGHHLSLHSNGSRQPDYYRELIRLGDLNLSVHFEFWNRQKFLAVVSAVTEEKAVRRNKDIGHLEVKIMMTPGRRQEVLDLEAELRKIKHFQDYCTWAIVPVREGQKGDLIMEGYDETDFALFGDRA